MEIRESFIHVRSYSVNRVPPKSALLSHIPNAELFALRIASACGGRNSFPTDQRHAPEKKSNWLVSVEEACRRSFTNVLLRK